MRDPVIHPIALENFKSIGKEAPTLRGTGFHSGVFRQLRIGMLRRNIAPGFNPGLPLRVQCPVFSMLFTTDGGRRMFGFERLFKIKIERAFKIIYNPLQRNKRNRRKIEEKNHDLRKQRLVTPLRKFPLCPSVECRRKWKS